MNLPTILKKAVDSQPVTDQISSQVPGIFICRSSSGIEESLLLGDAVSARVSAFLNRGEFRPLQTTAEVDPRICRGCGTCIAVCQFGAATLIQQPSGVYISDIDEVKCQGCGTCVAHCPSNAITQHGLTDCQITASLEAMLIG